MYNLLIQANEEVEKHIECGALPFDVFLQIERTYSEILTEGLAYHKFLPALPKGKRGKQKQRDGKNLLDRLKEKRDYVLRFIYDFSVAFTNNQGERDIRMVKLKQKIAGTFVHSMAARFFAEFAAIFRQHANKDGTSGIH